MKQKGLKRNSGKTAGTISLLCCILLTALFLFAGKLQAKEGLLSAAFIQAGEPVTVAENTYLVDPAESVISQEAAAQQTAVSDYNEKEDPDSIALPSANEQTAEAAPHTDPAPEKATASGQTEPAVAHTASNTPSEPEKDQKTVSDGAEPAQSAQTVQTGSYSAEWIAKPAAASGKTIYVTNNGVYTNMLSGVSDTIDYELSFYERGVLHYSLSSETEDSASWKVRLYQEYYVNGVPGETALRCLNTLNADSAKGESAAPGIGLAPGKYYIRVSSGSSYSHAIFQLSIEFKTSKNYEIEYNDSATRYTEIYPDIAVMGSASNYEKGQDADWYMLRTYAEGALSVTFLHLPKDLPTVAFKVSLYDAEMHELYSGNSFMMTQKLYSGMIGVPAGVYFIQVQGRVYFDGEYTLKISRESALFESEPNDTFANATPLQLGRTHNGALSMRSGNADKDYYVFSVASPGYVSVYLKNTVLPESSSGYIRRLKVSDSGGDTLYSALLADNAEELRTPSIGLAIGTYYVSVDNADLYQTSETYEIGYSFTPSTGWERENNNTPELATSFAADTVISGTLADVETLFDTDWYSITVDKEGTLLLNLSHTSTGGTNDIFRITLFDAQMKEAGETIVSRENTENVSEKYAVVPGTYYIKITAGKYKSEIRYFLSYSMQK